LNLKYKPGRKMARHRFFVNKISEDKAEITGGDYTHAATVLRMEPGEKINVFNYEHGEYEAEIQEIDRHYGVIKVKVAEKLRDRQKSTAQICAIISLIKKDKMELMLEKLTELGIDEIIPVITNRTVIKVKDEEKKNDRWEKIIYSAVKQCGRLNKPKLLPVTEGIAALETAQHALKFFIYEKEEKNFLIDEAVKLEGFNEKIYFIIGPEGGFDEAEAELLIKKEFIPVSIGDTILRAETAAISAASVLVQAVRRSVWKS